MDNGRCAFVIDRVESALGFADSGGEIIDAAPLPLGRDAIKQMFGYLKDEFPRQPIHDHVEVENPGPATAIVVANGHDSGNAKLHLVTRYTLRPGSCALEVTTTVTNQSTVDERGYSVGDAVQWGQAERFAPGFGDAVHGRRALAGGYLIGYSDGASYAYVTKAAPLDGRHGGAWSDLNAGKVDLPAGGSGSVTRWLVVGPPDGAALLEEVRRITGADWQVVSGTVVDSVSSTPLGGARVILESAGHPMQLLRSRAGAGPNFAIPAPRGSYLLRAEGLGRGSVEQPITIGTVGEAARVTLAMPPPGTLRFLVVDADGRASPAKLTLIGTDGTRNPYLGAMFTSPGGNVALTARGDGQVTVPPGHYRVVASRGPFFDVDSQLLEVPAGGEVKATFTLRRAVDVGSYRCADLHQHAQPSPDSGVSLVDRAVTNLAEGLDVIVPTDHNMLVDWGPTLSSLPPLPMVLGNEATLDLVGHWNAYPMALRAGEPRGGALDVRGLDAHGIVAGLRAADGAADRVIQVNHPRAGIIGYFNMTKLDAASPSLPSNWEGGWDAIEVFSGKDLKHVAAPLADWRSLLDRGLHYTGVGGSDSHLVAGQEVGYPRTCVPWNLAAPHQPGTGPTVATQLVDAIKRRRDALVTNGPFISVHVDGKGMGEIVNARGKKTVRLSLEVQAAPWVDVRTVEILRAGGRSLPLITVPISTAAVRLKRSIYVPVDGDDYIIIVARGETTLSPVLAQLPGGPVPMPLALTNPVYIDDGDGVWRLRGNSTSHPVKR